MASEGARGAGPGLGGHQAVPICGQLSAARAGWDDALALPICSMLVDGRLIFKTRAFEGVRGVRDP